MTTGHFQEYVEKRLQSAREALSDAEYLLADGRLKAAANRAYYAMFYGAHGALAMERVEAPRTHGGTIQLFNRHVVGTGKLDDSFSRSLQDAYDLRRLSDYEIFANVGEGQVEEVVRDAGAFLAAIEELLAN